MSIISNILRRPLVSLLIILLSSSIAVILCTLDRSIVEERTEYEKTYATIPVKITVCDLAGRKTDDLETFDYVVNVFRSDYELGSYIQDPQFKMHLQNPVIIINGAKHRLNKLIGITSLFADPSLGQNAQNNFSWLEGYDESILGTTDPVCIIPENLMPYFGDGSAGLKLYEAHNIKLTSNKFGYSLKIAGTHNLDDGLIYCPFFALSKIRNSIGAFTTIDAAHAHVADNHKLDELREVAYEWFAKPNGSGAKTQTDKRLAGLNYFPSAILIDDSRLQLADAAMQNSIKINTMCSYIVLGLSAVAGFFVGFLAIRSRKREITLMRSLGNSGLSIFAGCCAEQLLCLVLGTAIGGAAFMWRPMEQLGLFMGIYFLGTIISLVIFISRNLLQGQKEDE